MGSRILLVDDEAAWLRTVGIFLKLAGYQVVGARDGKQALAQAEAGRLGAIVLDVSLAGEDSAELMRNLKAKQPEAQVVLYTGLEQSEEGVQRLIAQGAGPYLKKGNLKELVNCLSDISRKSGLMERGPRLAPVGAWQAA